MSWECTYTMTQHCAKAPETEQKSENVDQQLIHRKPKKCMSIKIEPGEHWINGKFTSEKK